MKQGLRINDAVAKQSQAKYKDFVQKLGDPKQDKKYQILEELELWLFGDSYLWKEGTEKQKRKAPKPVKNWQQPELTNPSRMIETLLVGEDDD
jgi:hypothetical protein